MERRLAAIIFTDIVGFTALAQSDEAGALRLLEEQDGVIRPLVEKHHGRTVKSMGDGRLIEFPDVLDAVECGMELQSAIHRRNARGGVSPLRLRVGVHLGDVQRRQGDILGDAVNVASRVEPLAEPGGLCLTHSVYDQVRNKISYPCEKLGARILKGVQEPVEVYRIRFPWSGPLVMAPPAPFPRVAVLPLVNISRDRNDEYFADGLTEELVSVLSRIQRIRVISRTSVNQYKGTTKAASRIGAELGVDCVLEGSVRKDQDRLRISVQLIDAKTDEHRWSEDYDRRMVDVFRIQADVAERVSRALEVRLLKSDRDALTTRPTSSLSAYELFLRAIEASHRHYETETDATDRTVVNLFEQAIREDPKFSEAYAYLANHLIGTAGLYHSYESLTPRVRELVARALELNPSSAETHAAAGNAAMQIDNDWPRAEMEFRQALAQNPSSSVAHFFYAMLLHGLQRLDESVDHYDASIELDPLWITPRENRIWTRWFRNDLEGAVVDAEQLMIRYPRNPDVRALLGWLYVYAGREAQAIRLVGRMRPDPTLEIWSNPTAILAAAGRPSAARALLARAEARKLTHYVDPSSLAALHALVGDPNGALDLLERSRPSGGFSIFVTYQAPWFDALRSHSRFRKVLRDLKLPHTLARSYSSGSRPSTEPVRATGANRVHVPR